MSPLAAEQDQVTLADAYAGEGGAIAVASDLVPVKTRPEVLVTGHAYAPGGLPVSSLATRLVVGEIDKSIHVVGDQFFGLDGWLGEPASFTRMPLAWERAAGGLDTFNPAGRALGGGARLDALGRVPAPNLLPPGLRIRTRSDAVQPVGFGPIAPLWPSRQACLRQHVAGWDPGRWNERPLPADLDLGYFNAAAADQQRTSPFGGETIYLENLHPRIAQLSTRLAPIAPIAMVDHGAGPQPLQLRCDTLTIDTDRALAMLVWRAHVLLDRLDRPGRVVITTPGAVVISAPAWGMSGPVSAATLLPDAVLRFDAALPFAAAAKVAAEGARAPGADGGAPPRLPRQQQMTLVPGSVMAAAVLPFGFKQGLGVLRNPGPPPEAAPALPFQRPLAADDSDGPVTPPRPDPIESPPSQVPYSRAPASWGPTPEETLIAPAPVVPWSPTREETLIAPAPVVPWGAPETSLAVARPPEVAPPDPEMAPPAPPALIGPIAVLADEPTSPPLDEAPAAALTAEPEATGARSGPAAAIAVEGYSPARCGALAARLACADKDADRAAALLRAEELDAAQWERVHEHWLDRIRDEAARSRRKLMTEYDDAYVGALEAERGGIALDLYARLADAAERGEVSGALSEGGLPEGAWPHIHRVWIGRMVKDVRLGKQVRGAIDAHRAA